MKKIIIFILLSLFVLLSGLYLIRRKPYAYDSKDFNIYLIYQINVKEIEISRMAFRCGGVEKINIENNIVYGQIIILSDTRIMTEDYPNLTEFKKSCDGYFIIDMQNNIKNVGLSEREYNKKLKENKIDKEAIDFYKFISKNGKRID